MAAKTLQGVVTSQKMNKTITVVVGRRKKHPKYGKYINLSTKYHVHDEKEVSNEGDIVMIQECKPISKTKNLGSVTINKKTAEENGIPESKSSGFFGFFESLNIIQRSKNLWKLEEKVSPVIKTQVNQCDATNKCVRQAWDRTKNKWIFNITSWEFREKFTCCC